RARVHDLPDARAVVAGVPLLTARTDRHIQPGLTDVNTHRVALVGLGHGPSAPPIYLTPPALADSGWRRHAVALATVRVRVTWSEATWLRHGLADQGS